MPLRGRSWRSDGKKVDYCPTLVVVPEDGKGRTVVAEDEILTGDPALGGQRPAVCQGSPVIDVDGPFAVNDGQGASIR